jgi:hypothetical protein
MRLLQISETGQLSLTGFRDGNDRIPRYAILSHRWLAAEEEPTFKDLMNGAGLGKTGYKKLLFCGEQARKDGLQYFWVDTCCINKEDKAELSHAINSMFRWYRNAAKCYVYLSDVSTKNKVSGSTWEPEFRVSKWFTRGWTLQELLAPSTVEFFSQEGERLGDKSSLIQQIHKITGVPIQAIQGDHLSQFSVDMRFAWIAERETTKLEDKAYSLLGIFGVYIAPLYGEGMASAFSRLREEISKSEKCTQHVRITDPADDKKRIEETKGGLLEDSCHWILKNTDFQKWRGDQQSRLLWIRGDPGKGKTMLLCGIINELKKSMAKTNLLSYFFCQANNDRINSATAVLRGLLYSIIKQEPSLTSHVRKRYDHAGKTLFEDSNAWVALSEIFSNILEDTSLTATYLVIDALDECVTDMPKLLDFIVQKSSASSRVKWVVSSRNWSAIEKELDSAALKVRLCLELNERSISKAVTTYINFKVDNLAKRNGYGVNMREEVQSHLTKNANNTFLWVALVCQSLEKIPKRNVITKLKAFPAGLDSLYQRMMKQIRTSDDAELCKQILAIIAIVYRPITLHELVSLVDGLEDMCEDLDSLHEIVGICGSFLAVRDGTIYFMHQSVKDYLLKNAYDEIFPSGSGEVHYNIFQRSLQVMSETLRRDMYNLGALGSPIHLIQQPNPDPLAALRYACIYWVDHLHDWNTNSSISHKADLQEGSLFDVFMRNKYLYWLEALGLYRSVSEGVVSMMKLDALLKVILCLTLMSHLLTQN